MNDLTERLAERPGASGIVEEVQDHLRMTDGFDLFFRRWKAVGELKRSVICLHGAGGYSEPFKLMAQDLALDGTEVYAFDARGFGSSKEEGLPRGDTSSSFKRNMQDLGETADFVRDNHPGRKVFMLGHSAGSNVILWYAAHYPDSIDGLILMAPGIRLAGKFPPKEFIKFLFLRLFAPKTMYDFYKRFPEDIKRGAEYKTLLEDPVITTKFSIRFLTGGSHLFAKALQNASRIRKPTLIIQGGSDNWALPSGASQLFESIPVKDKSIKTFPDADHHFYHAFLPKLASRDDTPKRKVVTATISDWLSIH